MKMGMAMKTARMTFLKYAEGVVRSIHAPDAMNLSSVKYQPEDIKRNVRNRGEIHG